MKNKYKQSNNFIFKEETYQIIGICMEVLRILGAGLLEAVYKDALEFEFVKNKMPFVREQQFEVIYKDHVLPHHYFADFVVFDKIVLEIKANSGGLKNENIKQTLNYIGLAKSPLGLLVNFGVESLEYKRLVL